MCCPSVDKKIGLEFDGKITSIIQLSLITIGREESLCGDIGVITMLGTEGFTIGPPADNEYAVEPKGVEKIIPYEAYLFKYSVSIDMSIVINLNKSECLITI